MTQSAALSADPNQRSAEDSRRILGSRIAAMRSQRQMTRKRLAAVLQVSANRLGYWERGKNRPRPPKLKELGRVLNIDVAELLAAGDANESNRLRSHEGPETLERRNDMSEETGIVDVEITLPGDLPDQPPIQPVTPDLKSERVQVDAAEPDPSTPPAAAPSAE